MNAHHWKPVYHLGMWLPKLQSVLSVEAKFSLLVMLPISFILHMWMWYVWESGFVEVLETDSYLKTVVCMDVNVDSESVRVCLDVLWYSMFTCKWLHWQVTFMTWDFGGQEEYYATHQCFLTQRSLYVLVWNVNDGVEGLKNLRHWLENIGVSFC